MGVPDLRDPAHPESAEAGDHVRRAIRGATRRLSPIAGLRAGAAFTSGQVDPYRRAWLAANAQALAAGPEGGPLWVVLGDSAAQGVGASTPSLGWVGQVRRQLETAEGRTWRVVNLSVSGARAHDVLDEQLPALRRLTQPVDLVVCAIGGNDMYRSTGRQIRDRFTRLVRSLPAPGELAPGQRTVLTTLPQGLARRRASLANTIVRTLAPPRGIEVADLWATTGWPWHGTYAEDHFHPNDAGYGQWAEAITPVVLGGSGAVRRDRPSHPDDHVTDEEPIRWT